MSVGSRNYEGETALHLAAGLYQGAREILQELLAAGADLQERNSAGETAVYYAVRTGAPDVLR